MSIKTIVFYVCCAAACLVLLPILAVAGAIALAGYAVISELGDTVFGRREKSLDNSTAREMAHRMCTGH